MQPPALSSTGVNGISQCQNKIEKNKERREQERKVQNLRIKHTSPSAIQSDMLPFLANIIRQ
jgi:hypothetical protein